MQPVVVHEALRGARRAPVRDGPRLELGGEPVGDARREVGVAKGAGEREQVAEARERLAAEVGVVGERAGGGEVVGCLGEKRRACGVVGSGEVVLGGGRDPRHRPLQGRRRARRRRAVGRVVGAEGAVVGGARGAGVKTCERHDDGAVCALVVEAGVGAFVADAARDGDPGDRLADRRRPCGGIAVVGRHRDLQGPAGGHPQRRAVGLGLRRHEEVDGAVERHGPGARGDLGGRLRQHEVEVRLRGDGDDRRALGDRDAGARARGIRVGDRHRHGVGARDPVVRRAEVEVQSAREGRRDRGRRDAHGRALDGEPVARREERERRRIHRHAGIGERQARVPAACRRGDPVGEMRDGRARDLLDGEGAHRVARERCRGIPRCARRGTPATGVRPAARRAGGEGEGEAGGEERGAAACEGASRHRPSLRIKSRKASAGPASSPSSRRCSVARTGVPGR